MTGREPPEEARFGSLLRRHREAAGLSQDALAARSGLSVEAISMLERGRRRAPRASTVRLLAEALRLPPDARDVLARAAHEGAPGSTPGWTVPSPGTAPRTAAPARWRGVPARRALAIGALSAAALVVVAAAVLGGPSLVHRPAPPLRLAGVQVRVEPDSIGHCPSATYRFRGAIGIDSGSGALTYHWVHPDTGRGRDTTVQVPAGTTEVDVSLGFQYWGREPAYGKTVLVVTRPTAAAAAPVTVVYACP